jgi:hypothetical protein
MDEITDFTTGYSEKTVAERDEAERKQLVATTKLSGWAGLMVFAVFAGGLLSFGLSFKDFDYDLFRAHPLLGGVDVLSGAVLFATSLVAGILTCRRARNAVFWLRAFFVILFVSNVVSLLANGGFGGLTDFETKSLVRGLIWPVIWFVFTYKSSVLATALPPNWRKKSNFDILAAVVLFALPIAALGVGISEVYHSGNHWYDKIEYAESDLPEGYATDGRIKFAILDGAVAEPATEDGAGPMLVQRDGVFYGVVLSGLFMNKENASFVETMEMMLDGEEYKGATRTVVSDTTTSIAGHDVHLHFEKLELTGASVNWRFAMLYAPEKRKVAIFSFHDGLTGTPEYFNALLESVQF